MVSYSSHKVKLRKNMKCKSQIDLKCLEEKISKNADDDTKQEFITVTTGLEAINNEKTCDNQIKARAMHIECNENNSAYFFNKEKVNYQIKNISTMHKEDGTVVTEHNEIFIRNCIANL